MMMRSTMYVKRPQYPRAGGTCASFTTGQVRWYETAVVATLRDRLRAGDVWVEGSRDYRRFDAYLPLAHDAERVLAESGVETDARVWLARRREWLHERLGEVGAKLARGRLEGVRLENACLRITPYEAVTPPAGERLDRAIDALMPRIRITDLLWEVNSRTGFLDAFTDLRSGRGHSNRNRAAILATVLAGATNLGLGGYTPPEEVERVLIARDGDAAGAAGAERLADRCRARGLAVAVLVPTHGDCNDELIARGAASLGARIDAALSLLAGGGPRTADTGSVTLGETTTTLISPAF